MKLKNLRLRYLSMGLACMTLSVAGGAQEPSEVEALKAQLQRLQAEFDRQQALQRQQIESLRRQIEALTPSTSKATPTSPISAPASTGTASTNAPSSTHATPPGAPAAGWRPSDPIRLRTPAGNAYMDISLGATVVAGGSTAKDIEGGTQLGGHDPVQRGFTLQGLELGFSGAVDPYFSGRANLVFQMDSGGGSQFELEEAYLETAHLPANLSLRAGQLMSTFGRVNPTHPHSWAFVDTPLVNGRFLGPDGLRNPGIRLSWLIPTPFFAELSLGVQNSHGETAYSFRNEFDGTPRFHRPQTRGNLASIGDLLFTPRLATSFNLTDQQTLLAGTSAAFGPNSSGNGDTDTQIYGADLFWKWKPANQSGGYPFVSLQTEGMIRRYQAGAYDWDLDGSGTVNPDGSELDGNTDGVPDLLGRETLKDYGFYSQLAYGFMKGWVAGLRGEYVDRFKMGAYESSFGADQERAGRWRIAPNLSWFPSEFSRIRLQYNYDQRRMLGTDHSIWLQYDFALGAHGPHGF